MINPRTHHIVAVFAAFLFSIPGTPAAQAANIAVRLDVTADEILQPQLERCLTEKLRAIGDVTLDKQNARKSQ